METLAHAKTPLTIALYAFAIVAMAAETMWFAHIDRPRDRRSRWLGVRCGLLSFGLGALFTSFVTVAVQAWCYEHRVVDVGLPWQWLVVLVLYDFMFYVSHRMSHRVRALWSVHVVHHSSRHFDLTAGIRGSVLDALVHLPFVVWIPLFGVHPLVFVLFETAFRFFGLAYHTDLVGKLGPLEHVLVTPSAHRVHHGKDAHYLDCNYGGFFIIWDRWFGTYRPETTTPTYGLVKDWHGYGTWDAQFHEIGALARDVAAARSFRDGVRTLVMPPGYSSDQVSVYAPNSVGS